MPCPRPSPKSSSLPHRTESAARIDLPAAPDREPIQKIRCRIPCQREFGDCAWTRFAASAKVSGIHQEYDMAYVVAIVAPGEMGSAVAARLRERGGKIITSLSRRSAPSAARAQRAPMAPGAHGDSLWGGAAFFFLICPPRPASAPP